MPQSITVQVANGQSSVLMMSDTIQFQPAIGSNGVVVYVLWDDGPMKKKALLNLAGKAYSAHQLLAMAEDLYNSEHLAAQYKHKTITHEAAKKVVPEYASGGPIVPDAWAPSTLPPPVPQPAPAPLPNWYVVSVKDNTGKVVHAFTIAIPQGNPMPSFYATLNPLY